MTRVPYRRRGLADFARAQEGAIGVLLAMFMLVSVGLCALAVDLGSVYLDRRTVQGAADLAAIAAASDLDRAEVAAQATLTANGVGSVQALSVIKGRYQGDPGVLRAARFEAGRQPYNAVRLEMTTAAQLHFAGSFMAAPQIRVAAIGTTDAQATFSIGSRLASVHGGVANAVLGALLGGNVSLSVMDYRALLDADVSLMSYLSALSTEVGVTAGTFDSVLAAQATMGDVLRAAAHSATASGQPQAASVVASLLARANLSAAVPLRGLVDLGPLSHAEIGQQHAGLNGQINLMSLISAAATAANGNKQVGVNLGAAVPGLLSLTLDLAIGEAAQHSGWVTVGQEGATVRTAQMRLRLVAEVGGSGLLSGVRIRLPVYVDMAGAEARLSSLSCPAVPAGQSRATIAAKPSVARAWIGDVAAGGLASFGSPLAVGNGTMVQAPLLSVSASAYAAMTNTSPTMLPFTESEVAAQTVKTAEVGDYLSSLTSSLLQSATINVQVLGLGLGLSAPAVKALVLAALTPVTGALDSLLGSLLELTGVHLGEVDVQVNGIRCGGAVLAG